MTLPTGIKIPTKEIIISALILGLFGAALFTLPSVVFADTCPSYMTDEECIEYLQDEKEKLEDQKKSLENKINSEGSKQQNIYYQLDNIAYQIQKSETEIKKAEAEIESNEAKIRILSEDIIETQKKIDELTALIEDNENTIQNQARESYITRFRSPLEAVLNANDFTSMVRRLKYLQSLREQFREKLETLGKARLESEKERTALKTQKEAVEEAQAKIIKEKEALDELRIQLDAQKSQQSYLLAESKKKEAEYNSQLDNTRAQSNDLDAEISKVLARLFEEGNIPSSGFVAKGNAIGKMGNTGCSSGNHLHFSINNGTPYSGWGYFWGNVNAFSGYLTKGPDYAYQGGDGWYYYYVRSGSYHVPLAGPTVLTQGNHQGTAIDLWSYYGAGAPVLAANSGALYKGTESVCGGKYALIEHPNGYVTIYLHLQ